ncbi:phage tail tape measure protein [Pseudomonas sp. CBSPBW29]|uniref:phage tail tape measure protein n=1 Tax=Pseudomonas sp. CBS TaxID=2971912 RepID=UPI0021ABF41A|nr:phage tail tape measure protein [Pseudomonas sp. CBS]WEL43749.1 phage tail tape measure protein [Pseudomonas sp. CBSPBW29]WEL64821.1 phage tail tape measure protein [Pseudomonas sp. CBSPGW29]WEL68289.1 phage tail tape measure protein [Pseudomonas sp. CBSPCGW29]WEL75310.1 phage tail tape measure protein [Pseudomonas sp. CBSPAW29]WEL88962.1 phage tail tape measure protein [Pseudomonas sp. CBSPCBW29]
MSTIAELGIAVNSGEAVKATSDLENLAQAGAKAEKAADGVSAGFDKAATATADLSASERKLSETLDEAKARLLATAKASLESSEYYQRLTTSVNTNASAMESSGSSVSSLASLQRRLQAESDALVGSTDRQAEATKKAAAATGVQAEGLQELLGKLNPTMAALDKLDQQQAQLQKYKAAGVIDADTFREYSTRIDASRQKLGEFDEGLRKTGISSGQTQAALRQLPAQFTDIFTSLVGGQNPLMVLIQQGGQIKDSFGGIGPTMDALKDKFRSLFSGGAGAAVLGESLAGIASGAKDTAENAGEASESLSDLAESSNTAAEAAENAQKAVGAISPAISGVTLGAAGMVLALVSVVAALGTVIYGYKSGSQEADEYNKSLILTGNYAGTSASRLAELAQQVSATNGTTSEAAASLAKLAASGVIAGGSFKDIADAAAAMEDATGKSVDATIAEFVKIAKDPVAAAKELNDQYHFLTASVYSQIVALKEQGDTIGAAKLLTDTYADTVKSRSTEITDNLGFIEKAWKGITDEAKKSLDAIKNIGRDQGDAVRVTELNQKIAYLESTVGTGFEDGDAKARLTALKDELSLLQDKKAAQEDEEKRKSDDARTHKEGIEAEQRLKQLSDSMLSNAEKRDKLTKAYLRDVEVLKKANPDDPKVQADYVAKTLQNIKDKNKDPKTASAGAVDLTAYNHAQNALKGIQDEYANTQKQLDAAQKAGLISQADYATQRAVLIRAEKDEVTAGYEAEIAALEAAQGKKATTAAQSIQLDQKIADARAGMVKAQKDADSQLEVLATSETGRLAKQERSITTYVQALAQQQRALELAGQRAVLGVGQGDRQNALNSELNSQQDRFAQQSLELANQKSDPSRNMSEEEFNRKSQALADANKAATDQIRQNYADVEAAQGDWTKGATSAWDNYLDSAKNIAGQTKSLFGNAFSSMEDAIVNFAMTGKASFSDFAKSILADMARIATRQASSALLSSLVGATASYFGGGGGSGGASQAGYTGTDLSSFTPGSIQAKGGAWSGGVQMFADGGAFTNSIVSKPTAFGMANGKTGVMGEAGDEAIMPLTRTANGKLGVSAVGGGGGGVNLSLSMPIILTDQEAGRPDGAEFDVELFQRNMESRTRQIATEEIAKSWRQGGQSFRQVKG